MAISARPVAPADKLIDTHEAAALVGFSWETFRKMSAGHPKWVRATPPFRKIGGRIRVSLAELTMWAAMHDIPMRWDQEGEGIA